LAVTFQAAWIFFTALLLLGLAWVFWLYLRSPYNLVQSFLFSMDVLLTNFLWRAKVTPLPLDRKVGGVIVVNHRSSVDPFFVQLAAGRVVHWMVAREFVEHFLFSWVLKPCEVIPVRRGGVDTASTKAAIRYAKDGGVIGMFPEGRINMTEDFMLPCRPGAAMIALKAGVDLIPCYIEGSPYNQTPWSPFFMPAKVKLHWGEPIEVARYNADDQGSAQALMIACLEEIARLAGKSDWQPRLAGKNWMPSREQIEADMALSEERNRKV